MSVAGVILAAGLSSRFARRNTESTKLVSLWRGAPLVRHVAVTARVSGVSPILVVTGHAHKSVEDVLCDLEMRFIYNAKYALGLSTSLRIGIAALPAAASGALILLGDMPKVRPSTLRRLMAAHEDAAHDVIALVPTFARRRGNPVLLGAEGMKLACALSGDEGARSLLCGLPERVVEVPVNDEGVLADVDRPEEIAALGEDAAGP